MNRTDYLLGADEVFFEVTPDLVPSIISMGRTARRRARLDREAALRTQSMPISRRITGWRRYGIRHGHSFATWSPWLADYRGQLHLAVLRGSEFAARQLSQALVDDVREVA